MYGVFLSAGVLFGWLVPPQPNQLSGLIAGVLGGTLGGWAVVVLVYFPWGQRKLTAQLVGTIALFWAILLTGVPIGVMIGWMI
jgi:hypothetical protein